MRSNGDQGRGRGAMWPFKAHIESFLTITRGQANSRAVVFSLFLFFPFFLPLFRPFFFFFFLFFFSFLKKNTKNPPNTENQA